MNWSCQSTNAGISSYAGSDNTPSRGPRPSLPAETRRRRVITPPPPPHPSPAAHPSDRITTPVRERAAVTRPSTRRTHAHVKLNAIKKS